MIPAELVAAIEAFRYQETSEDGLQRGVSAVLTDLGCAFDREVRLNPIDRIDFMVARIGIECKIRGALNAVLRQLQRYAQCKEIDALILVTTKAQLARVPRTLNGKPIAVALTLGALI